MQPSAPLLASQIEEHYISAAELGRLTGAPAELILRTELTALQVCVLLAVCDDGGAAVAARAVRLLALVLLVAVSPPALLPPAARRTNTSCPLPLYCRRA